MFKTFVSVTLVLWTLDRKKKNHSSDSFLPHLLLLEFTLEKSQNNSGCDADEM